MSTDLSDRSKQPKISPKAWQKIKEIRGFAEVVYEDKYVSKHSHKFKSHTRYLDWLAVNESRSALAKSVVCKARIRNICS